MAATALSHRADLQGLRALAILLVVLAHAGVPGLAGGFVGVDVFFVLSGYLITGLLVQEHRHSGRIRLLAFLARRLRRLLPALLLMLGTTMALGTLLLSDHELVEQTASVGYAATWTSNLFFAFTTFDYFAELHLRDLYLHTWSLAVEEQFYLVWPLFCWLALARFGAGRAQRDRWRLLLGLFGLLFVASLGLSLYWTSTNALWAFYLTPARVWQFALGAAVYLGLGLGRRQRPGRHWRQGGGALGLLLILGSAVYLDGGHVYPGLWALLPSTGAALLIAAGSGGHYRGVNRVLAGRALEWLGDRSYSWYLWHWPLLMLGFAWGLQGEPSAVAGLVGLSLLVAMASYRLVELPFWKGRYSAVNALPTIAVALSGIAALAVALVLTNLAHRDSAALGARLASMARDDIPRISDTAGCDTWFHDAALKPCTSGAVDAQRTVVLFGDSIAAQWYSFLSEIFASLRWRVVVLTKSACAMVDEDYHYPAAGGLYQVCTDWRNAALRHLARLEPDLIFVGSAASYDFSERQWTAGSQRILDRLADAAGQVVVIAGTPSLSFDGPGCLERWLARHAEEASAATEACREPVVDDRAARVADYLERAVAAYDNAALLRLNDLVCPGGFCAARNAAGQVVFRDRQHLTDSFVRAQVPAIRQRLAQLGLDRLLRD